MSSYEHQASRPSAEFLKTMRAADPGIIGELAVSAHDAMIDHQRMSDAVYWLATTGADPEADADQRERYKRDVKDIAGRLETDGNPDQVYQIIRRYEDRVPVGGRHRGEA